MSKKIKKTSMKKTLAKLLIKEASMRTKDVLKVVIPIVMTVVAYTSRTKTYKTGDDTKTESTKVIPTKRNIPKASVNKHKINNVSSVSKVQKGKN